MKIGWAHKVDVQRPARIIQQKVISDVEKELNESSLSIRKIETSSPLAPGKELPREKVSKPIWTIGKDEERKVRATTPKFSELSSSELTPSHLIPAKTSLGDLKQCGLTSKQQMFLLVGIATGVVLACATVAILPPVFLLVLRQSSSSLTTTTTVATVLSAFWTFDQTTADSYSVYNGTLVNSATYLLNSSTQPYLGDGQALSLTSTSNQSFVISTPFFNLSYTSFTVEAWIYPTNLGSDRGIIGQCACATCANQCFYLLIRSNRLYVGFTANDLSGKATLSANTWYHIAFVYNYNTRQQILYLNGVQDSIQSNAQPYQGINGSIKIGAAQVYLTTNYFNGYIDNMMLSTQAKSSTEILYDASVIAYYSFDLPSPNNDNGPNGLNGLSTGTTLVTGRVNQAMRLSTAPSYFQAYGFYQIGYSINSGSFSISLWLNPSSITSCTIVQILKSQFSNCWTCDNIMGIYSNTGQGGQLVAQSSVSGFLLYGPSLSLNTWKHVSLTYSTTNGFTFYVNGILFSSSGGFTFSTSGTISTLLIGYNFNCCYGSLSNVGYQGSVDEIYIHNRELTQADVSALANP
ncbi:unnamed protein product [Rotaria sp. Silwood2]|nr:unnamed protein product [Rotaria sp. Silwood2]CAF4326056.1 unnamed protein product [Rotaria sp. Silwood2]